MGATETIRKKKILMINNEILKLKNKLTELEFLLTASPALEIISIRKEFANMLQDNPTLAQRTSDDFLKQIDILHNNEQYWYSIAKKQKNSIKLIDKKVEIAMLLDEYQHELFKLNSNP